MRIRLTSSAEIWGDEVVNEVGNGGGGGGGDDGGRPVCGIVTQSLASITVCRSFS